MQEAAIYTHHSQTMLVSLSSTVDADAALAPALALSCGPCAIDLVRQAGPLAAIAVTALVSVVHAGRDPCAQVLVDQGCFPAVLQGLRRGTAPRGAVQLLRLLVANSDGRATLLAREGAVPPLAILARGDDVDLVADATAVLTALAAATAAIPPPVWQRVLHDAALRDKARQLWSSA